MSFETCPKNVEETVACIGFANAKARSRVTNVGPWSGEVREAITETSCVSGVEGCGEEEDTGFRRQTVVKVLNNGLEDEATAWHTEVSAVYHTRNTSRKVIPPQIHEACMSHC